MIVKFYENLHFPGEAFQMANALFALIPEARLRGVDAQKRARLIRAGADAIEGDFLDKNALLSWLGLKEEEKQ